MLLYHQRYTETIKCYSGTPMTYFGPSERNWVDVFTRLPRVSGGRAVHPSVEGRCFDTWLLHSACPSLYPDPHVAFRCICGIICVCCGWDSQEEGHADYERSGRESHKVAVD